MALLLKYEDAALRQNLKAYTETLGRDVNDTVKETARLLITASLRTGKKHYGIPIAPRERKAMNVVRRFDGGECTWVAQQQATRRGETLFYAVKLPVVRKGLAYQHRDDIKYVSGVENCWVFQSEDKAREYQAIKYRGIGWAGFLSLMPAVGGRIASSHKKEVAKDAWSVPGIGRADIRLNIDTPSITLYNTVQCLDGIAYSLVSRVYSNVNARLVSTVKRIEGDLEGFWKSGGVRYNHRKRAYE